MWQYACSHVTIIMLVVMWQYACCPSLVYYNVCIVFSENGFVTTEHVQWKPLVLSKLSLLVEADALYFPTHISTVRQLLIVFSLTKIA